MASRVAKYGIEFNFFAVLGGTKTKFMKFGECIALEQLFFIGEVFTT